MRKLLLIFCLLAFAAFPQQQPGQRVYDQAGTLTFEDVQRLEGLIARTEAATSAEMAVVTVWSLDGMTVEDYANELFNSWGIGKKDLNNGVLFVVGMNDRRARIEVGHGLEHYISDGLAGSILDDYAIPYFKEGDYKRGIIETTEQILKLLDANPEASRGVAGSTPSFLLNPVRSSRFVIIVSIAAALVFFVAGMLLKRRESYSTGAFIFGNLGLIALLGGALYYFLQLNSVQQPLGLFVGNIGTGLTALFYNWRAYARYGPHGCSKCGAKLVLLEESKDDEKLNEVQRLEEQLGSVDYDIWYCPACLHTQTEQYVKSFSGFGACPKCTHRTHKEERTTIRAATTASTGLARVVGNCASCKHTSSRTVTIPRISTSSSSSSRSSGGGGGSSFGGGSSGGGGASRGW